MEYLDKVLGIKVVYEDTKLISLPNFILTRYDLKTVTLDGHNVIFIYPKVDLEEISKLKKHINVIRENNNYPIVLILKELTYRMKEYLIRERIPFIVDNKQIYLPFMGMYLQEKCDSEKLGDKLLPSAQMLLLYFIYGGSKELSTIKASRDLDLTPTSISRASRQLEELGLLKTKKSGVNKLLLSDDSPKELFNKAKDILLNPVKKVVYIPKEFVNKELLKSGYTALSNYSMLNDSSVSYYATNKISRWNNVIENNLCDSSAQAALEIWRYDPYVLSKNGIVDELSLALSLKDDNDERIMEAIEEMLNNLWKGIDDNRN